jgi:high-affinity K+ transport system ATPase subunit B
MFAYDSAEDYFAYRDQVDAEAAARAQAENELEAYHAECEARELEDEAQVEQYEADKAHYEDNIDIPF